MEPVPKNMLYGNNNGANAVKVMAGLVRASEFGTGTWAVGRTLDQDMLTSRARSEIISVMTTSTLTSNQSSTVLKVNEVNTCKGIVKFIKYFQTLLQAAHVVISAEDQQPSHSVKEKVQTCDTVNLICVWLGAPTPWYQWATVWFLFDLDQSWYAHRGGSVALLPKN